MKYMRQTEAQQLCPIDLQDDIAIDNFALQVHKRLEKN